MRPMLAALAALGALAVSACATGPGPAAGELGTRQNPVRVSGPAGERAYLARLRCSDGTTPAFERGGSVGVGPYGNILDIYDVRCPSGSPPGAEVYMDMYHNRAEDAAVPGFTIVPR